MGISNVTHQNETCKPRYNVHAQMKPGKPTDTRQQERDFGRSLMWMTLLVLVIGGGALLAGFYGITEALIGLACLLAGAGMILFLWLLLTLIGKLTGEE